MKKIKYRKIIRLTAIAVLAIFTALFSGILPDLAFFAETQFAPAVIHLFTRAGIGAALTVLIILMVSFLFGRWYCALWCPLGAATDLLDLIPFFKKRAVRKDLYQVRLVILSASIITAAMGTNTLLMWLDPYSNFGQITAEFSSGIYNAATIIIAAGLLILAVWKRRFFCTTICPVGSCLNIAAKHGVFRLGFTEKCIKCKQCEKVCPAGCIDVKNGTIDNGRCIRCLACLDECKFSGLTYGIRSSAAKNSASRREFIKQSSAALGGAVAGTLFVKLGMDKFLTGDSFSGILPPGAENMELFKKKCLSCLLCVQSCPQKIIRPAIGGDGPVSLDLKKDFCKWECNNCSVVCPAGAIKELTLIEKQHTQIALAQVSEQCIGCGVCISECPAHAITATADGKALPDPESCAGCGKCAQICPHQAITLKAVPAQKNLPERTARSAGDSGSSGASPGSKAVIDPKVCFSCGNCVEVCPVKAITLDENETPKPIDRNKCIGCGKCVAACPAKAITLTPA